MAFRMTPKGLAVYAAIKAGLIPEAEEGFDVAAFNTFWDEFTALLKNDGYVLRYSNKGSDEQDECRRCQMECPPSVPYKYMATIERNGRISKVALAVSIAAIIVAAIVRLSIG